MYIMKYDRLQLLSVDNHEYAWFEKFNDLLKSAIVNLERQEIRYIIYDKFHKVECMPKIYKFRLSHNY